VETNQQNSVKLLSAVIAASAVSVMGILALALHQEQAGTVTGSGMSTGQTITHSKAPTKMETSFVSPVMKAHRPKGFH
jgi:hypothetical protein